MKITGAHCLAEMLGGYGVTHVFMVPAVLRRTFAEMERRTTIARIHTHGEKAAAYMADGYARASGKPGICMAQVVGALNLAAGLRDAYLAHSPVIAFTGGREPKTKFRKVYQELDDMPSFEPVTKWNATVDAVERFPDMVRQAFRVATSGAPGPAHGSPVLLRVTPFAGRSDAPGDVDGPIATATFRTPASIGADLDGNIYIADSEASTIRLITADGTVRTAAGNAGEAGSSDGTRGFATLNHPRALAVTAGGYVYVADTDNNAIRQFYPAGNGAVVTPFLVTLAGATQAGTSDGSGNNARFNHPAGIAIASNGTVYVGDTASNLVRRVVGLNAVVTTIAGRASEFNAPTGIAVDAAGNLFIADTDNHAVRKIARDGTVTTFAGTSGQPGLSDGLGVVARFNRPTALALDSLGNLYVADTGNNAIRRIAPSTLVTTVIASGLNAPTGVAFDFSWRLLIADSGNHVIRVAVAQQSSARRRSVQH